MLEPYLKVLARLVLIALREENAKRRKDLLQRFVDSAYEDINLLAQSRKKKRTDLPVAEPDEPDDPDEPDKPDPAVPSDPLNP